MIYLGIIWLYSSNSYERNLMFFGYLQKLFRAKKFEWGYNLTADIKCEIPTKYPTHVTN